MRILLFIALLIAVGSTSQNRMMPLNDNWTFHRLGDEKKYSASVPGTIHTDLLANKLIPDPFLADNEKSVKWVEDETWVYETSFNLTQNQQKAAHVELRFDGLDTYGEVTLNGRQILVADNMFRTWTIEVGKWLKNRTNSLKVVFKPVNSVQKSEASKLPYTLPESHRVFTRKAQYHFGWDWGPKLVTCGIWKPVSLHFRDRATISNIRYEQISLTDEKAELRFIGSIWCDKAGEYLLKVNSKAKTFRLKKGMNILEFPIVIDKPKRWWTNGLGEPFLYLFSIKLLDGQNELDEESLEIGLRTVELVQEKDAAGKSFYFKLNGVPVFMKGANYIPPDNFLPRVTDIDYQTIVNQAIFANMNMLRVWGGGVYPDDAFYRACDRNGILVWQDFMFACAMYPGDDNFLKTVTHEIIDNVNRLQNHASLALWCGNNENDEGWHNWGWQKQFKYSQKDSAAIWNNYDRLFHKLIPKTLDSLTDKSRMIYWPSSPSHGWGRKENLLMGDSHYWGVWWGNEPFEIYKTKVGRFMSEFGFQGMPPIETFREFAPENELHFESGAVKNHQKHPTGYATIDTYMKRDYVVPTKFEDYIYVSQLLQADGMKTAIEAHRRAKPYCMGSLYWQLNDCWPVTSWSSIDSNNRRKALHYQAKRSFSNFLLSIDQTDDTLAIWTVNDKLNPENGLLTIKLMAFDGTEIWKTSKSILANANKSDLHMAVDLKPWKHFAENALIVLNFAGKDEISATHLMARPKDLRLQKPAITWRWIDERTLQLTTDTFAKSVCLSADAVFDDNFFDLLPGTPKTVSVSKKITDLKITTLFDTL